MVNGRFHIWHYFLGFITAIILLNYVVECSLRRVGTCGMLKETLKNCTNYAISKSLAA